MVVRERMSGVDAAWLHMDRPTNTADVVALFTFADRVRPAVVRRVISERLLPHARFRQRIVPDGPLALASWADDPAFSLERHLSHRRLPGGGSRALERFASAVATERLAPDRPLWHAWVVDGFGKGSAVVAKLHHCIADGFALVGLLLSMADEVPAASAAPSASAARPRAFRDLRLDGPLLEALGRGLASPSRALDLGARGIAFASSLARMALLPADPPTRLSRPLGGRRRAAFSRALPLARVRDRARALGVTVNDLLVAALAGALRGVLAADGPPPAEIRALVPVNLRGEVPGRGDPALGNRFGLVFLPLPVGTADPVERLARIREAVAELKRSPDAVVSYGVLYAVGHLPQEADRLLTGFFSSKASLVVTNVPGPRERLHLSGHEIDRIMFNVPHPATLGLGVSILSYAGEVRVGVRADVAVLPDPGVLARGFAREVEALGGAAPVPG
jgi:diacylglycerol O-acyltransferase